MNDQETPLVMEMVEFSIKVLHFCKSIQRLERNFMCFLIRFGIYFCMSSLFINPYEELHLPKVKTRYRNEKCDFLY